MNPNLKIRILVANNPRRFGSHGYYNFNLYRNGMTVAQWANAPYNPTLPAIYGKTHRIFTGQQLRHLRWDIAKGFVELY